MNSKNITLFNYVYSSTYDSNKSDELKWEEFGKLCMSKMNYAAYDFIKRNKMLLTMDEKNMWQDLAGNKETVGKFVILNFYGQKEYIDYKVKEIKAIISNYGNQAFKNLENIFDYMCNEAIREILNECRNKGLIEFSNNIFMYASNRLYNIFYDDIKIIINDVESNINSKNIVINNGEMVYQLGNGNIVSMGIDDDKLFELLESKLETIKIEMKNNNCEDKLEELERGMKKKDRKSVLSILSELASIGSFIATMFINN
ncbi:MAG: hypothetical protein HFI86_05920 [Bacilli bacterium]|nr:hypothetical protein [Bacilli bacterium]